MDIAVFGAVLFSAVFQAGWNFFTKKSQANKTALLAVGWFILGILMLPIALFETSAREFSADWVPFILATGFIQGCYFCLLGWAYTIGEISVVFPVSRGLGVLGTTIGSLFLGLHGLSTIGALGIGSVVLGTFLIGLKEIPMSQRRTAFFAAGAVALSVMSYTLVDSIAARRVPLMLYISGMNILGPLFAAPFLLKRFRDEVQSVLKRHKLESLLVAIAASFAYAIVLWAYQRSETAYVAALREFSVVIAAAMGIFFLNEAIYKRKIAGILLILLGVIFIKLA